MSNMRATDSSTFSHREVRDIHCDSRIDTQSTVHGAEPGVRESASRKGTALVQQGLIRRYFDECPNEHRDPRRRDNNGLQHEQPPDALWRHKHEWHEYQPIKEEAE